MPPPPSRPRRSRHAPWRGHRAVPRPPRSPSVRPTQRRRRHAPRPARQRRRHRRRPRVDRSIAATVPPAPAPRAPARHVDGWSSAPPLRTRCTDLATGPSSSSSQTSEPVASSGAAANSSAAVASPPSSRRTAPPRRWASSERPRQGAERFDQAATGQQLGDLHGALRPVQHVVTCAQHQRSAAAATTSRSSNGSPSSTRGDVTGVRGPPCADRLGGGCIEHGARSCRGVTATPTEPASPALWHHARQQHAHHRGVRQRHDRGHLEPAALHRHDPHVGLLVPAGGEQLCGCPWLARGEPRRPAATRTAATRPSTRTTAPSTSTAPIAPSPDSVSGRNARASATGTDGRVLDLDHDRRVVPCRRRPPPSEVARTPNARCTTSPPGTRIEVSTIGASSSWRWRTAASVAGWCHRSSAPIHQSRLQAAPRIRTQPGGIDVGDRAGVDGAQRGSWTAPGRSRPSAAARTIDSGWSSGGVVIAAPRLGRAPPSPESGPGGPPLHRQYLRAGCSMPPSWRRISPR